MKTIITYGTFDLFHFGHVRLLKRLRAMGDKLIVGLSTDEFNAKKGKLAFYSFHQRKEILQACRYVDQVIPETKWQQKCHDIEYYYIDIFAMGSDWQGKFDDLGQYCQVIYLDRTGKISTSGIKTQLAQVNARC